MVKLSLLLLSVSLHLLFQGSLCRQQEFPYLEECRFDRLDKLEATERLEFEAGRMDYWDHTSPELRCAGVALVRTTIHPNGLFLPTFFSSPALSYVVQGEGVMGAVISGCPETFQEAQESQQREEEEEEEEEQQRESRRFWDMHQKVQRFRRGEVFALTAGISRWWYSDGDTPVVIVTLLDITNRENQLDQNPRMFQIAGSASQEQRSQRQRGGRQVQWASSNNLFNGFDPQILAEAFHIDVQTAQQLQNQDDSRGNIVRVRGRLRFVSSHEGGREWRQSESTRWQEGNGFEETFCTARLHENIDDPSRADAYSSRAGRISTLNSYTLPVLRWIRLNAMRGVLYGNGMVLPHWTQNAHSVMYVTGGRARVQVVDDNGQSVFDDEVSQGQVVVVPQGFAVVKRAEENGFEWISFKTNDNAKINTLAGRISFMRAMPVDVIAAAYRVSEEEAKRIKFSRDETALASTTGALSTDEAVRTE